MKLITTECAIIVPLNATLTAVDQTVKIKAIPTNNQIFPMENVTYPSSASRRQSILPDAKLIRL